MTTRSFVASANRRLTFGNRWTQVSNAPVITHLIVRKRGNSKVTQSANSIRLINVMKEECK